MELDICWVHFQLLNSYSIKFPLVDMVLLLLVPVKGRHSNVLCLRVGFGTLKIENFFLEITRVIIFLINCYNC